MFDGASLRSLILQAAGAYGLCHKHPLDNRQKGDYMKNFFECFSYPFTKTEFISVVSTYGIFVAFLMYFIYFLGTLFLLPFFPFILINSWSKDFASRHNKS